MEMRNANWLPLLAAFMVLVVPALALAGEPPPAKPSPQAQFQNALAALGMSPEKEALREKVLKLGARVKPPIPAAAQKAVIRGGAFLGADATGDDVKKAVEEFRKAVDAAPWWAAAYYNLAIAEERLGLPEAAIEHVKLYLLSDPADAEEAEKKIIELEVMVEKFAPVKRLEGEWLTEGKSVLKIKTKGRSLSATYSEPNEAALSLGYRSGDLLFSLAMDSDGKFTGKCIVRRGEGSDSRRCFGVKSEVSASGSVSDGGNQLTILVEDFTFNVETCAKMGRAEDSVSKFFRK